MPKNHVFTNTRIQTKRDTAANWELNNPVLLNGEEILVDTNAGETRKKVGDGTKKYNQLPFIDEPIRTLIGNKVDKVSGKGLSTNDYTTTEKEKLAGIEDSANNYKHPDTHPATMIKEDTTHRFVTDAEKSKLSGIEIGANKTDVDTELDTESTNPVQNAVITNWLASNVKKYRLAKDINNNVYLTTDEVSTTAAGPAGGDGTYDAVYGIMAGNEYKFGSYWGIIKDKPSTFPPATHTHIISNITDLKVATTSANGLMSSSDKTKLDGIDENANKYVHPDTHPATMITQDSTHRFVSDAEKSTWNAKASTAVATTSTNGLMSSDDKSKLDGIDANANKYTHPSYTAKDSGLYKIAVDSTGHVNGTVNVTKADITKLGIPAQDTTYTAGAGLDLSGNVFAHINSVTAGTAKGDDNKTLTFGGTFTVPTVKYDAQGHITSSGVTTMTMPAKPAEYSHPATHPATMITDDTTHRFVTDDQIADWNSKASSSDLTSHTGNKSNPHNVTKSQIGLGSVTNDAQVKRTEMGVANGVATLDNNGKVPSAQLPSYVDDVIEGYYYNSKFHKDSAHTTVITEESGKIYIDLDTNKTYRWAGKAGYVVISETLALGETSSTAYPGSSGKANADAIATIQTKLNTIDENANKYVHPDTHPATMITQDATHRFVSDAEKSTWSAKASTAVATTSANGLMSSTDKTKLDGIDENANKYVHPDTHPATMIEQDATHRFVTDTEKSTWNAKASTAVATTSSNGLMSSTDKTKLDGIDANANKYTHPTSHPATMITEDTTHRFVTDTEKSTWNAKASTAVATTSSNGLMSSTDKANLEDVLTRLAAVEAKIQNAIFFA